MVWSGEERDTDGSPDCLLACLAWQCGDVEKEGRRPSQVVLVSRGGLLCFNLERNRMGPFLEFFMKEDENSWLFLW